MADLAALGESIRAALGGAVTGVTEARGELTIDVNAADIVAIEWLAAAQAVDFHAPLKTSAPLERARVLLRGQVPHLENDRMIAPDIEAAAAMIHSAALAQAVGPDALPSLPDALA